MVTTGMFLITDELEGGTNNNELLYHTLHLGLFNILRLWSFLLQEILFSSQPFLLGWWILLPFVTGSHFLLPFPWGRSATLWKLSSKWIVRYLKSICKDFWAKLPYITFNNLARRHPSFKAILTGFNHIIILLIFFTKEIKLQDCWSKVFEIDLSDDNSL